MSRPAVGVARSVKALHSPIARHIPTMTLHLDFPRAPAIVLAALLAVLVASACSTLPERVDRKPSSALADTGNAALGRIAAASVSGPGKTATSNASAGFRLLVSGEEAYGTLFTLIERAERSLDLQYYIIKDDEYSRALLRAARNAAARGVRVRVLLDDLYTAGKDERIAWYSAHPNIEVRVFNPFRYGRAFLATRLLASLTDLSRINRRMHNKLFVADNAFAVTGGRNIGAEYYMHSEKTNFLDADLLLAGPAVRELSRSFDAYWNSEYAYPIEALTGAVAPSKATVDRKALSDPDDPVRRATEEARQHGARLAAEFEAGRVALIVAPARVIVDRPTKVDATAPEPKAADGASEASGDPAGETIERDIVAIAKSAHSELIIVSPYFVPGNSFMAVVRELTARGVKVRVLTNSLAATDAAVVHIGYSRYREALLKLGVELYELRPAPGQERAQLGAFGSSKASLHAKVLIVDRKTVFLGSYNVDPRSALQNTEMGLRIESPELARQVIEFLLAHGDEGRYRVQLAADGHLQWVTGKPGHEERFDREPDASPLLKFTLRLLAPFAPEQML